MKARTWLPWIVLGALLALAVGFATLSSGGAESKNERMLRLASELKCVVCSGETVAESNSSFAVGVRDKIGAGIDAGESDAEILASIVALPNAGEQVLLETPADGVGAIVWVVPIAAILFGAAGLGFAFARWRRTPRLTATDADEQLVAKLREGGE